MKIQIKSAGEAEVDEIFFNKNTNKVSYKNKLGIITDLLSSSDIDEECLDGVENSFDYKMRIQPSSTNVRAYVTPEEIINDVFVKWNEHIQNYDVHLGKLNTWLYHIAKNKIIDYYRKTNNNRYVNISNFVNNETGKETFQIIDNSNNVENVENIQLLEEINKAMSKLKPTYKNIAQLFFIEQKKYNEISEILNIPLGTVKGNIARIRSLLQNDLKYVRQT
jgi:RNA polymerase sigma-70 factor (ECF subfamily)